MWRASFSIAVLAAGARADVLFVGPTGLDFDRIQPALDAAGPGDLILVRPGEYEGSLAIAKPVVLAADVGGPVRVLGTLHVQDVPAGAAVVVTGIDWTGGPSAPALAVSNCAGIVRFQDCELRGGDGLLYGGAGDPGGEGASIEGCAAISFLRCKISGGAGSGDQITIALGGEGGHGLAIEDSVVALHASEASGGVGGDADYYAPATGGPGGDGCRATSGGLFAAGSTLRGGRGGTGSECGESGSGLYVQPPAEARLLEVALIGGPAPRSPYCEGPPGAAQSGGGAVHLLPGTARTVVAPTLALPGSTGAVTYSGEAGDRVVLVAAEEPAQLPASSAHGLWLVHPPLALAPQLPVEVDASGEAAVPLRVPELAPGEAFAVLHVQLVVHTAADELRLTDARTAIVPACGGAAPDCDGNGVYDGCDLLAGTSPDVNQNGYPDACDPDCNGNGLPDDLDIGSGRSLDRNANGVPDECEPFEATWYVDAAAPPGGDGSSAAPFDELADAFETALPRDLVLVAAGVYRGERNKDLDFIGRDFAVMGVGGAEACTIDCEDLGRAFVFESGETSEALVRGFTILDGRANGGGILVDDASPTIADCIFRSCRSTNSTGGGALRLARSASEIRDCLFEDNGGPGVSGAVHIYSSSPWGAPVFLRCDFVSNAGVSGGAVNMNVGGSTEVSFAQCRFLGNRATSFNGGAIESRFGSGLLWLDQCLFAGNSAARGGALSLGARTRMTSCTLAGNVAWVDATIYATFSSTTALEMHDSVIFANSSPGGHSIALFSTDAQLEVWYSDLEGGQASISLNPRASLFWHASFDLDPLFVDPDGADDDPATFLDNDWRLGPGSPCVDSGRNGALAPDLYDLDGDGNVLEPVPYDLDGAPRRVDDLDVPDSGVGPPPIVDLGCFERQP